jgi:Fic family protein
MRDTFLAWRREILKNLGGLPEPEVKNKEWLYLLKKETRNSIMVEGIFVKEEELEAILFRGNYETRNASDVLNYFRTAKFIYGLGFENFINRELILSQGFIRQINKGILEGKSREPGVLRKGKIVIKGAEINPPEFDLDRWLQLYVQWVKENIDRFSVLRFIALQHSLFEALHPFEDGNGRTGRILSNYFLVSRGFPIVTIKGDDPSREVYYRALQEADTGYNDLFRGTPDFRELSMILESKITESLEMLIFKGLRDSMDRIIISLKEERGEKMLPSEELASLLGYSRSTIRKLVERGKLISVIRGSTHFSHPSLLYKES